MTQARPNARARAVIVELLGRNLSGDDIIEITGTCRTIDALRRRNLMEAKMYRGHGWRWSLTDEGREAALRIVSRSHRGRSQ